MELKATKLTTKAGFLLKQLEKKEKIFKNIQTIEKKISNEPELMDEFNKLFGTNLRLEDITSLRSDYFTKEISRLNEAIEHAEVIVDSNGFYAGED